MNHVVSDIHAVIASDSSWCCFTAVGRANQISCNTNCISACPCHTDNRARGYEFDKSREKRALGMDCVMCSSDFFTRNHRFETDKFQSFLFKSSNNFTNESSLNSIRLYHNIRSFHNVHHTQPKITPLSGMRRQAQLTY